jgi:hypothetical protein
MKNAGSSVALFAYTSALGQRQYPKRLGFNVLQREEQGRGLAPQKKRDPCSRVTP